MKYLAFRKNPNVTYLFRFLKSFPCVHQYKEYSNRKVRGWDLSRDGSMHGKAGESKAKRHDGGSGGCEAHLEC